MFCFKKILHKYHKNITLKFKSKNSKVKKLLCGYTGFGIRTHSAQRIIFVTRGRVACAIWMPHHPTFFIFVLIAIWIGVQFYLYASIGEGFSVFQIDIVTLSSPYCDPIYTLS